MKTILITGGAGFIGSHLADALIQRGDRVIALDDLSSGHVENIEHLLQNPRFSLIQADVLNLPQHLDALRDVQLVYHLAAQISGFDSLHQPDLYFEQNLKGLMRVIELAKQNTSLHITFASSSTVYGLAQKPIKEESDLPEPATIYALTKLAGEHMLAMYPSLLPYTHTCLRLFNVYGPRQNPDHPYANVTCKFSRAAALQQPIKLYGDGAQTRDFIYIDDVIQAFLHADSPSEYPLYNVGTSHDHSIAHLVNTLEQIVERRFDSEQLPPWPNDIQKIIANTARIQGVFGWQARTNFADGLRHTVQYFQGLDA